MNGFDAGVVAALVIAVVTGFNAGLLRSAVTILTRPLLSVAGGNAVSGRCRLTSPPISIA